VNVSQLLYDFGQTSARIAANEFAAQALGNDVVTQKANVVVNVQRAYYDGLKRQRLVQIAEETVREREVIKHQVDSLYQQQLKAKLDLDLVQVELSTAEVDLIRAGVLIPGSQRLPRHFTKPLRGPRVGDAVLRALLEEREEGR